MLNKETSSLAGGNVAHNNIDAGELSLHLFKHRHHTFGMAVSGVDNDSVNTGFNEGSRTLETVASNADAGSHAQASVTIFASIWFIFSLCDIFIGNKTYQFSILVNNREFLNLVALKNFGSLLEIGALSCCDKVFFCHHLIDAASKVALETQITVGYNTDKIVVAIDHRDSADMILAHHIQSIVHC